MRTSPAGARSSTSEPELARHLAAHITDRDREICRALYEHRVLTTIQLAELHFDGIERARKRLAQLHQLRVLDRFRPYRQHGSRPYHYTLDRNGAQLIAAERGLDLPALDWTPAASLRLATSRQLRHLTEAAGFVTRLAQALRQTQAGTVSEWWGQRRCGQAWGEVVRPDAYLRLAVARDAELEAWLEWDRGTEPHSLLRDKVDRYEELAAALERPLTLLLVLPADRREREAHRTLQPTGEVAWLTTTAERHHADPLARNWLAPAAERRVALAELAGSHQASTSATTP